MNREENVIKFYCICNRLKNIIRKGWKNWNVNRERIESVAEHIFGTQMLAVAIKSEYEYDVDIMKVIYMLAIHELGETIIDDLTQFEISGEEKKKIEHKAVHDILCGLLDGQTIEELFLEFDTKNSKEAFFAYQCDKLECDLQCKLYDEEDGVDLSDPTIDPKALNNSLLKQLIESEKKWSTAWLKFDQQVYPYDDNFRAISSYALNNEIHGYTKIPTFEDKSFPNKNVI